MKSIDQKQFAEELNNGANILDVRESDEFESGHVPGATFFPLSSIQKNIKQLDKDTKYYVICRSGARSQQTSAYLEQNGYDVVNVIGGTISWQGDLEYGL
ncbi:rhodanese-like domain-containing protein [Lactobacillus terrae]|uniref:rhodanese-like domain-containing protein n=1 Tax=Lactobacillus terrae TaxID=2269374 RepID=UPI000C1B6E9B|nr:rhodanese-like domain-containing protein [Lactobacillus terrae]